jgi:CDP-diglyceride synthetase
MRRLHLLPALCGTHADCSCLPCASRPTALRWWPFSVCVVWAGDIFALYVGRAWGRHKMAPTLSPNKTWEGTVGSLAGSLLAAGGLLGLAHLFTTQWDKFWLSYPENLWYWLGLAVLVNVAAQVGDLAESALKRSAGVKDSGCLLPGTAAFWIASTPCCLPLRCCGTLW